MPELKNQAEIVAKDQMLRETGREVTDKLRVPGLTELPSKTREEVAEVLVNVLKSRKDITRINWKIGESFIEVSYLAV
jgi:hypothetical protein